MRWMVALLLVLVLLAEAAALEPDVVPTPEPTPIAPSLEEIKAENERTEREKQSLVELFHVAKELAAELEKRKNGKPKK